MKKFNLSIICIATIALSGCAEMLSVTTIDEIHRSKYQFDTTSNKSAAVVNNCMKEALVQYRSDTGRASYATITFRDFDNLHDITLRAPNVSSLAGAEIYLQIENSTIPPNATRSQIWVNQMILNNGGSQGYLDRVIGIVRPCLGEALSASGVNTTQVAPASVNSNSQKLKDLQLLRKDGLITEKEYQTKRQQILDKM